ncbi:3'-5' exonuclease [Luteimonas sp. TWI662]|uniref:3'-5' exonuclease n=1 Tax=Luteimonas sp. TWI662 TaxID=3136789 RepID=UPI0032091306
MRLFYYDTETTGLPAFRLPSSDPTQPHIVQFAAVLWDTEADAEVASIDLLVRPDGWEIPAEAAAIHGITNERAADCGVSEARMLDIALELWRCADRRIGYNEQFDARLVRIAALRFLQQADADTWSGGDAECAARMATPVCKMPPSERMRATGRSNFKTPKLSEAHELLIGEPLRDAHSAMADVRGLVRVHRYLTRHAGQAVAA